MEKFTCEDIDKFDAWDVYYSTGSTNFVIEDTTSGLIYLPVFLFDKDGFPTDLEGYNFAI